MSNDDACGVNMRPSELFSSPEVEYIDVAVVENETRSSLTSAVGEAQMDGEKEVESVAKVESIGLSRERSRLVAVLGEEREPCRVRGSVKG